MKRIILLGLLGLVFCTSYGQQILHLYRGENVVFEKNTSEIDSVTFRAANSIFNYDNDFMIYACDDIDSITFSNDTMIGSRIVYITYQDDMASIVNPLENQGVSVTSDGADVTVNAEAGLMDVVYFLSGSTQNGSLTISSDKRCVLTMNGVTIVNPEGPAINVLSGKKVSVNLLRGTENILSDAAENSKKAAFLSKGQLVFDGWGVLKVSGLKKHAIQSDEYVRIDGGDIQVLSAVSDGIHCAYFVINDGSLTVDNVGGDAVDGDEGFISINGGNTNISLPIDDTHGLSCDSTVTVNGGSLTINVVGNQSKGISSGNSTIINNGFINITASGNVVLEESGSGYDPSYCTAIKSDSQIVVMGGNLVINCTSTNQGGKGLSADGDILIYDGYVSITTNGAGATYTNEEGVTDSYTCACIKGDANMQILGGTIECRSTGSGGKGINVDGTLTIGRENAENDVLTLTVVTTGARFLVSSGTGGGGGWNPGGPDDNSDYANPKAIKSMGDLTVNSGNINITCSQDGGEGIESKSILTINGGNIEISTYDDCINAGTHLYINDGHIYCTSSGNDAIDSNGPITVTGGLTIANGSREPEEGMDCDNYSFTITGGVIVATGGNASTSFQGNQKVVKYSGAGNRAVQIVNANNDAILTYQIPSISGGGPGGGPGGPGGGPGGGSNVVMIFSDPQLAVGSYTLKYGGTITGGTDFHGYYTGATYTGGSTKTFSISSAQMTSVSVN